MLNEATLKKGVGGKTGCGFPFLSSLLEVQSWDPPRLFLCTNPIHTHTCPPPSLPQSLNLPCILACN